MKTLHRRRDPQRESHVWLVGSIEAGEQFNPGDVVMLESLGACLVLSVRGAAAEQTFELEVETLAHGNLAPDLP